MKILVTGHRGFVGQHMVPALKKAGHQVVGYSKEDGQDIRDQNEVDTVFEQEGFDAVIHMAALAGVRRSEQYPEDYISTNVMGTMNIVRACEKFGVKKLINFSSASVYGGGLPEGIKETDTKEPISVYGMTKLMAEHIVNRAKIETTVIIRPFTLYGEGGRKDQVMFRWLEYIKGGRPVPIYTDDKEQASIIRRGYTYVGDLIEAVIKTLSLAPGRFTFNIGGGVPVSILDLMTIFESVVGKDFRAEYVGRQTGDVESSVANTERAFYALGWTPKTDIIKKLRQIIKSELRP